MAQEVGEQGIELALAAAIGDDAKVLAEAADLLCHMTLLLRQRGLSLLVNEQSGELDQIWLDALIDDLGPADD
jgi:phosphoribosyl-ATP pyrophosphohydrolase